MRFWVAFGHRNWSLGRKLFITFLSLAVMVGVCGIAALIYFERIAGSVSILSEITSPLLIESMALIENADNMRSTVLDGASHTDANDDQLPALRKLDAEGREHVTALKALSTRAGMWSRFEPVEQLQSDFVATLEDIVNARNPKIGADRTLSDRYAQVNDKARVADTDMTALALRFQSQLGENEALVNAEITSGTATSNGLSALFFRSVGSRSGLQRTYDLTLASARVHDLAQSVMSADGELNLGVLEGEVQRIFTTIAPIRQRLSASIQGREELPLWKKIDASLNALQAASIGPEGLVVKKRQSLTVTARLTARLKKLSEIQLRYMDVLTGVAAAVRVDNATSMARTATIIEQGRAFIMAVVGLAALLGIGAALYLTHGITTPLNRLTKHVRSIRERGDLTEISDPSLVDACDELGDLSRAFNGLIVEVAEARRQLIARSEAEISKQVERLEAALTNMTQGLCMFDHEQRVIVSNRRYAETYGIAPECIRPGTSMREVLEARVKAGSYYGSPDTYVDRRLNAYSVAEPSDTYVELANGRTVHSVRRPMSDGGWLATHDDVTERRRVEAKIAHMAQHDALTNLPNRVLFRGSLEQALKGLSRGARIAVLCLDLDRFKSVNDTLGHSIGDALLRAVTERLVGCVRDTDLVARLGGDEFAIIQASGDGGVDAGSLAQRLIDAVSAPYELDGHQVVIGVSIGIAVAPDDGTEPGELLRNADLALYRAKKEGREMYRFFEAEMDARMQARRTLEADLRRALAVGEFELYYQPLVSVKSAEITGFEALLRWHHPELGLVLPTEFISVAEEIGLMVPLGEWVLRRACQEAATWPSGINVAVNLSPVQFKSRNLVTAVTLALSSAGLSPARLELEITESLLLEDSESTLATLHQLKNLGARISMDDFGTGYSSLSYLRSFPFDKIKIDRSFIRDLADKDDAIAIVRAVTGLGESLGMTTTAEGVETKEQFERLRSEGCTEVQGYLFSQPRPANELAALIASVPKSGIAA